MSQPRGFPSSCPAASPPARAQGTGSAHSAAMALAATRRPRGRLRSVMARTILGLDMVDTFTSSETCRGREEGRKLARGSTAETRGRRLGSRQSPGAGRAGWGLNARENPKLKSPSPSRFPRSQGWVVPQCRQSPGLQGAGDGAGAGPGSVSTEHGATGAGKWGENEQHSLVCSKQHLELPPVLESYPQRSAPGVGLTMVKGMNCRMLPRLPCSRQSTHSSMNHCTNWVWVPAVLAPRMEEMSRKRFAVETEQ